MSTAPPYGPPNPTTRRGSARGRHCTNSQATTPNRTRPCGERGCRLRSQRTERRAQRAICPPPT
eukprot:1894848-Lingulodinium_polyedra.AAC.1